MSATLIYLKIQFDQGPVTGESTAGGFEGQIEIESFDWGMKIDHVQVGTGTPKVTEPRPKFENLKLEKFFDASSTVFVTKMKNRTKMTSAKLTFAYMSFDGSGQMQKVMEIDVADGYVEEISLSSSGSGKSMAVKETVNLSFRTLKLTYYAQGTTKDIRATGAGLSWTYTQPLAA